jgi:hypothetical protein
MKRSNKNLILKTGTPALFDTFAGPIRCKVLAVKKGAHGLHAVTIQITATKGGPYKRGEIVATNCRHAVPRGAIYRKGGQYRIGPYTVEPDA